MLPLGCVGRWRIVWSVRGKMGAATRLARADSSSHQGGRLLPGCSDTANLDLHRDRHGERDHVQPPPDCFIDVPQNGLIGLNPARFADLDSLAGRTQG
jgi:hypothetical protein